MQKRYRLKSGRVFNYLHKKGESNANKLLVLVYAPSKYPLKVGFIVSKKVSNRAVARNKVRRRLREAFRALIPYIDNKVNYIVIARDACESCDFSQLANSLTHLLIKCGLFVKNIDNDVVCKLNLKQNILDKMKFEDKDLKDTEDK